MYRIRSASGNEVSYNSLEEFSAAVRRGEVHPEDEIFHTRANRWLDVKSHPHYRSATTWQHHEPAGASARPATPVPAGGTAAQPAVTSSKAQVFERPVVRTAPQTTVRPQLQPEAKSAPAAAPATSESEEDRRPRKSKEIAFIDVGDVPGTKPMPSMIVAPMKAEPKPEPKVEPKPELKVELKPEPRVEVKPEPVVAKASPVVEPPAPPASPAPKAAAPAPAPAAPSKPGPKKAVASTPDTEAEFLVMDGGIESPVRTSAGFKTVPEDLGLLFDAPLPKESAVSPNAKGAVPTPSPVKQAASAPAASEAAPATAPAAPLPQVKARAAAEADMEVLPATLLEAPVPEVELAEDPGLAPSSTPSHQPQSGSRGMLFGGGAAMIVVVAGLLAWRPWKSAPAPTGEADPAASAATAAAAAVPSAKLPVPVPQPMPIRTQVAATVPGATGKTGGKPADSAVTPSNSDSADEVIIAASKPSFRTDVAVPAPTDFSVGEVGTSSAVVAPTELIRRLSAAERQAQQDLNTRLSVLGFRNVLAPEHLGSAGSVASAKAAWSAGADAVRQYRGRIARLERAYEDSVLGSQRAQRWPGEEMRAWASHQSLAEPSETSQLADLMFSQVNEGLDILAALSGEYTIKGQSVAFKNAASATRYTSIRNWVEQRTSTWQGIPESARPYSVTAILRALGDGFPAAQ